MDADFLNRLYMACVTEGPNWTYADGLNLGELYRRIPETQKADRAFSGALADGDKEKLDDLCCDAKIAYEKQGFINGFRTAMRLCIEGLGGASA